MIKVGQIVYYQIRPWIFLEVKIREIVTWWDTKNLLQVDRVQSFETAEGTNVGYYNTSKNEMIDFSSRFEEIKSKCKNFGISYWLEIPRSWNWGPYRQHCGFDFESDNIYLNKKDAFTKIPLTTKILKIIKQRYKIRSFRHKCK